MRITIRTILLCWMGALLITSPLAFAQQPAVDANPKTIAEPSGLNRSITFVHPGIPLTKSDLESVKANLTVEPWKSGYDALVADKHSQLDYRMQGPFEIVTRNPHLNRNPWMNDMQAVFNLARMGYFTGDTGYSQKAHDVLLAWANTQKTFGGIESNLDLGDFAYRFAGGAEILRGTWPGWTAADTAAVKALFNNVYWPASGADGSILGPANKGMLTLAAGTAIAVFDDDQPKLNHVLHLFRTNAAAGLRNTLPSGEIGESARDQGHAYGQWVSMAFLAESLWKQDIDVYALEDNRLLAIGEYYARVNLGIQTPYLPFGTTDALYLTNPGIAWPHGRMGMNLLISAYSRKKLPRPYLEQRRNQLPVDMDNFMFEALSDTSTAKPLGAIAFPLPVSITRGLISLDLGEVRPAGTAKYEKGSWTLDGAGKDISTHEGDSCHFEYLRVVGDGAIVAKVESVQNTSEKARAGVMIRDSLSPTAANRAWIGITPVLKFDSFMHGWTDMRGGKNWERPSRAIPENAYWIKLERLGNVISTYTSPDGVSWAAAGVAEFSKFDRTAYMGLVVCSGADGARCSATFSQVKITGGDGMEPPKVPPAPFAIYASPGDAKVPLRWLESDGAESYTVMRSTAKNGPFTAIASVKGTSYIDLTAANDTTYFYAVIAKNSAGESGRSIEDRVLPHAAGGNSTSGTSATQP